MLPAIGGTIIVCVGCGRRSMTTAGARIHENRCKLAQDFLAKADDGAVFRLLESALAQLGEATRGQVEDKRLSEGEAGSLAEAAETAWEALWDAESRRYRRDLQELAEARDAADPGRTGSGRAGSNRRST